MPKTIHGKPVNEAKWKKAKTQAAKEGHAGEYDYVMGIYKKMVGMKAEQKSYVFRTDQVDYQVVETKSGKKFFVTGYISTSDIDIYNDLITENGLKSMLQQLTNNSIKLDYEHEVWRDNDSILPVGKIVESKIDDNGLWVKAQLNDASPKFKDLWTSIKNGFVDAFSIAFVPKNTVEKSGKDGMTVRIIDDLELLNVAFTSVPINPNAKMDKVFTKALSEINEEEDKMAEEEENKTPEEEKEEEQPEETEATEEAEETEAAEESESTEDAAAEPEESPEPETKSEIDMKAFEERILKSIAKKIDEAIDKKLKQTPIFKSMQREEKVEEKSEPDKAGMLDYV